MKILVTGATGFIGRQLAKALIRTGHQLVVVTRNRQKAAQVLPEVSEFIETDLMRAPLPEGSVNNVDAVIHLMGENISSGLWTTDRKRKLYDSRVASTRNLVDSFAGPVPQVWIQASAVGYYGDGGDTKVDENSPPGNDFLAELCRNWERELKNAQLPMRKVIFRLGLVLSSTGGIVEKMSHLFRANMGGRLGNGQQWMSWIHLEDLIEMICLAVGHARWDGVINAVSPEPVTNREWTDAFVKALKPIVAIPAPAFVLKLAMGELGETLLCGQRVMPERLQALGYQFRYPHWRCAISEVLQTK